MKTHICTLKAAALLALLAALFAPSSLAEDRGDWAFKIKLPKGERRTKLFNGRDFTGWVGQTEKYWSISKGQIRGANQGEVPASSYLFSKKSYRNFRLLLEVKQTRGEAFSTMHSAVCVLGEKIADKGEEFSFKGPLLMFCNDWGIWEANRRNRIFPEGAPGAVVNPAEKVGEWNRIEALVVGDHIQMAANGVRIIDFTDKPGMLTASQIGLQLHANSRPQEYHFRGLTLVENPKDELATLNGVGR